MGFVYFRVLWVLRAFWFVLSEFWNHQYFEKNAFYKTNILGIPGKFFTIGLHVHVCTLT